MQSVSGYIFTDLLNPALETLSVCSCWSFSLLLLFTGQVIFLYVSLLYAVLFCWFHYCLCP